MGKVRRTKSRPGSRPCLTHPRRARTRTHVRDPGVAFSDRKRQSASTPNSPGAPADYPVGSQAITATGCRKPRQQRAQPATNHGTGTGARQHPTHTPQTPARKAEVQSDGAHKHQHPNTPDRSGRAQAKPEPEHTHAQRTPQPGLAGYKPEAHTNKHRPRHPSQEWRGAAETQTKHTNPHRTAQPRVAGYKRSAPTNTNTPKHPSQEWWGAAETGRQAHTSTPHTPVRSGGVQAERAHKLTHTSTPRPGVAGRSQNPSPSTHTHTAEPSQEWRGTGGARQKSQTHPDTRARSGGEQWKLEPKHTHTHRTGAGPRVFGSGCE